MNKAKDNKSKKSYMRKDIPEKGHAITSASASDTRKNDDIRMRKSSGYAT